MKDKDWTVKDGRANSSDKFVELMEVIEDIIISSARDLIGGKRHKVARLILAVLAHKHGMAPPEVIPNAELFVPKNLEGCFKVLKIALSEGELTRFKEMPEGDYIKYHHNLGRCIRNNWNLWEEGSTLREFFESEGINHADDMSGIILQTFHRHLNEKDLDLIGLVEEYKAYSADYETGTLVILGEEE
jgi:hypothetical protein